MAFFFDLHTHMLCGVDDGAKTPEEMFAMLEMAYDDGVRAICLTPHYSPYLFGDTFDKSKESFEILKEYAAKRHPDMYLYLGHELGYHDSCIEALDCGKCRTLAGSRYVLIDFPENVGFFELQRAMNRLQRSGYLTILAHTERYRCLFRHFDWIKNYVSEGGIVQLNASSVEGSGGTVAKMQWKKMIKAGLCHIISSDGHNLTTRQPKMSVCMNYLKKHCKPEYIRDLTWNNACLVVTDKKL